MELHLFQVGGVVHLISSDITELAGQRFGYFVTAFFVLDPVSPHRIFEVPSVCEVQLFLGA